MVEAAFLDDWELGERNKPIAPDPDAIEGVVREIAPRWSADLFLVADAPAIENASRRLAVTASSGHYSVASQLGEGGPFANLIGDPDAEGEVEFAHGGQAGLWPSRFCVSVDDAVSVARHYVATAELLDPSRWWRDD